jgi:hypothetical protein
MPIDCQNANRSASVDKEIAFLLSGIEKWPTVGIAGQNSADGGGRNE